MREAIGRHPTSFLDNGLTTTTHQRIPAARRRCGWGDVCSPSHATPIHKETSHVAVHSC
jgi:hypothetical protein